MKMNTSFKKLVLKKNSNDDWTVNQIRKIKLFFKLARKIDIGMQPLRP